MLDLDQAPSHTATSALQVRVCIPHFFRPGPSSAGYGSTRSSTKRIDRALALGRCLSALLNLRRQRQDLLLSTAQRQLEQLSDPHPMQPLELELIICTDGQHALTDVLRHYRKAIRLQTFALDDPRQLPIAARDHLIHHPAKADLSIYLEDDICLNDSLTADKLLWFLQACDSRYVLMPHRYEAIQADGNNVLYVDGALSPDLLRNHAKPAQSTLTLQPGADKQLRFDVANNPHSGFFAINETQRQQLQEQPLPIDGFVGPLETAATLTVASTFPVFKPCWDDRFFLQVEHAHPSYLYTLQQLPQVPQQG